ncbi:hypothetical protein KFE25_000100 [Diacronema lutheri]|uniref:snRNA-activating protein complex subunit 3 n=2 Tax=Diacronema lutheri TaxID=2081491 RepID=A0A8J5XH83_DIALT|nr:hypothetical protein KFE25_000100 [Diacronema lutheri]
MPQAFPTLSSVDQRYVVSAPLDVGEFARWAASARLDAVLAAEPELGAWYASQRARATDVSLDGLEVEAPQELLLRRVREEVAVVVSSREDMRASDVPVPSALCSTGVALADTARYDLPLNHGLPLDASPLESVQRALRRRAEQKRTTRGRESDTRAAALSRKRALAATAAADGAGAPANAPDMLPDGEVLLRVAFFHARRGHLQQELIVAGSHTLGELRDRLRCDVERIAEQVAAQRDLEAAALPSRASAFLIGGRFFSDAHDGVELAEPLRAWMRAVDPLGAVARVDEPARPMRTTRISELRVRLGEQYLFVHVGECEHVVVFTDVWAATEEDERLRGAYPMLVYEVPPKLEQCFVCKQHAARHLTVGSASYLARLSVDNPSHLCEACYHALHYGPDGQLLHDDFRSYELQLPTRELEPGDGELDVDDDEALAL